MFSIILFNFPPGVSNTYSWVSGVQAPPVALETLLQMYVSVEVVSSGASTKDKGNLFRMINWQYSTIITDGVNVVTNSCSCFELLFYRIRCVDLG